MGTNTGTGHWGHDEAFSTGAGAQVASLGITAHESKQECRGRSHCFSRRSLRAERSAYTRWLIRKAVRLLSHRESGNIWSAVYRPPPENVDGTVRQPLVSSGG
jgi:hypothetical protein